MPVSGPDGSSFVSCPCGCKSASASRWFFGLEKCGSGKETAQDWLDTFRNEAPPVKAKAAPKKKTAESTSKAATPTKDIDSADKAESDDEVKEKKSAKKQKVEKEAKEPKTAKVQKEVKKSEGSKRPNTAFFLFNAAKREEAKVADADSKPISAKELGEMWKAATDEEKEPFVTKAAELKAEFDANKTPTESEKKKKAKSDKPLGPRSSYILYGISIRVSITEEFPGIKATEIMKLTGSKWKELSAEEKMVFTKQADAEKKSVAAGEGRGGVESAGSKRKSTEDETGNKEEEKEEEEEADEEEEEVKASQAVEEEKTEDKAEEQSDE